MRFILTAGLVVLSMALVHRAYPAEHAVPAPDEIVSCFSTSKPRAGDGAWQSPTVTCSTASAFLKGAKVVTKEHWQHDYSHVALADNEGILTLRSGDTIRWLLRPGGLGRLTFPDGSELHLVQCCGS